MKACRPAHRRITRCAGFNLIEMIIVISIMGALMSLGIVLLGLLMRTETAGHEALAAQLSVSRCAQQFRADAHDSIRAIPAEDGQALEFHMGDQRRALWLASGPAIERRLMRGEAVAARESYVLPDAESRFSADASGQFVELVRRPRRVDANEPTVSSDAQLHCRWRLRATFGLAVASPRAQLAEEEQ